MYFYPILCGASAALYSGADLSIVQVHPSAKRITHSLGLLVNRGIIYVLVSKIAEVAIHTLEYLIRAKLESQTAQGLLFVASVALIYFSIPIELGIRKAFKDKSFDRFAAAMPS